MDLTFFPFDKQVCEFRFESWSYIESQQTLTLVQPPVNLKRFGNNEHWNIIGTDARTYTPCYNYTVTRTYCYPGAEFKLLLERKSVYYVIMIIVPSIIFSVVELVSFSLPLAEVSKLQITFTCLLSYAVFQVSEFRALVMNVLNFFYFLFCSQTTARTDMPRTSEHDPLLSLYFDLQMGFIAFALFGEAAVFTALEQAFGNRRVPKIICFFFAIPQDKVLFKRDQFELDLDVEESKGAPESERNFSMSDIVIEEDHEDEEKKNGQGNAEKIATKIKNGSLLKPNASSASLSKRKFSIPYPNRDILSNKIEMHSIFRQNSAFKHGDKSDRLRKASKIYGLCPRERMKWHILAIRIERSVFWLYCIAIIVTPIIMFYVARLLDPEKELRKKYIYPDDRE